MRARLAHQLSKHLGPSPVTPWLLGSAAVLLSSVAIPPVALAQESADAAPRTSPKLAVEIAENGPQLPWQLAIRNTGSTRVLVAADPRLLWFEVKAPGKKRVETCRLPPELYPDRPDPATQMWLEPGEAAGQTFDPRLYCYSEGGQWQLVPGSQITPHFGWPEKTRSRWEHGHRVETIVDEPPYVARSDREGKGEPPAGERLKQTQGETFALGSSYAAWARSQLPTDEEVAAPFRLKLMSGSDAHAERTATIRLMLKNQSPRARYVYFRRELVSFEVMGPDGLVQCDPEPDLRAPERHSFSYLPAGKSLNVTSRLVELCPRGTFARPGLYLVHARFDATHSGEDYDLDAFVGRVSTTQAVGVRIRTGEKHPLRLRRIPVADPAPHDEDRN